MMLPKPVKPTTVVPNRLPEESRSKLPLGISPSNPLNE